MNNEIKILQSESLELLKTLIATPSFSKEEEKTANIISDFLINHKIEVKRFGNNIYAQNKFFDKHKESILLNSHHDTVPPNKSYTIDPFSPIIKDEKLFGLGSNDAGGALVSLLSTFIYFYNREDLKYNLIFVASAEEEISGINGFESIVKNLPKIYCAIVGEPTEMQLAIAEKGLLVLDCEAIGKPGHIAAGVGENAINKAVSDINWINSFRFEKISDLLGEVKLSVTVLETDNKAHNITPDKCRFVVDCRVNELYTLNEVFEIIKQNLKSNVTPRSFRLCSSVISENHPLVLAGKKLGRKTYGSPTTSDKALMPFAALKLGPGVSTRSHSANEFIFIDEIFSAINLYIQILEQLI